tara:strand:- start:318 stop:599 length:282 start_codon:yes stop_codon:yes gene_type:complete
VISALKKGGGQRVAISRLRRKVYSFWALHRDALVLMVEDKFWVNFLAKYPVSFSQKNTNIISISYNGSVEFYKSITYRKEIAIPENFVFCSDC